MFEQAIVDQNPHWDGSLYHEGVRREVLDQVLKLLDLPHVLSLVGVRRAGKSTLARQAINHLIRAQGLNPRHILFLNLETPQFSRYRNDVTTLERAFEDYLKLVTPEGTVYCFLDEVHFFPEWQVFVKSRYEQKNVKFIVTGSNSHLLSSEFITLLSGRALPVVVHPFSFAEFARAKEIGVTDEVTLLAARHLLRKAFDEYLRYGAFPEIAFIEDHGVKREILVMYARNILYQDIAPRFAIKKVQDLEQLFFYLVSNVASLYTYSNLSKLVGLNDKTIKDYLSYFADAYLLFTVDAFSFSVKEQIRSPKKVYAVDTGMAAAAAFSFSENLGHYLENLVFLTLKRSADEIYYYKTTNGLEVDFACRQGGRLAALIQVARDMKNEKVRNREFKTLLKALDETGLSTGTIVTYEDEEETVIAGKTIHIVPAYKYFYETVHT
jgi:uncharacterized protein